MSQELFEKVAQDLQIQGYSINPGALPANLSDCLLQQAKTGTVFEKAGIGREQAHVLNESIRSDEIAWIGNDTDVGKQWLSWADQLQQYINRRLYLGLFSFESHFAHYAKGDFYKRHVDAFKGQANRMLTVVAYLNDDWQPADGGEFVLYLDQQDENGIKVLPTKGTVAIFLSEEFPHEVLAAGRDRFSIAGWYRVNTSTSERIDPPS